MDKGKIEAMVTKLSEKFAIIMLKKHRKFCRRGLTHLDATPIFENRSDTYETPCSEMNSDWGTLLVCRILVVILPRIVKEFSCHLFH